MTEAPKPKAPKKVVQSIKDEKKPFVRKPYMTVRPFSNNEGLMKLRSDLDRLSQMHAKASKRDRSKSSNKH